MRKLTSLQKKVLDKFIIDYKDKTVIGWENIPEDVRKELESINWYETLHSDAARYIADNKRIDYFKKYGW